MPIIFKVDVIEALKNKGFSTYQLTKGENAAFSASTLQKFRKGDTTLSLKVIERLCELLECQPSDLIEYVKEHEGTNK